MKKFSFKYLIIYLIRFYRFFISPIFVPACRFSPTCSSFAIDAINKYGVVFGAWLALKRLFRCNPLSRRSGYDPLP
tara:strand:+ start:182 stop:409 length:228 start_codon:yes stop_codon:yes gene_type:complete